MSYKIMAKIPAKDDQYTEDDFILERVFFKVNKQGK